MKFFWLAANGRVAIGTVLEGLLRGAWIPLCILEMADLMGSLPDQSRSSAAGHQ